MVILGIDPGLATIGYGVVDYQCPKLKPIAYGAVLTPAHTPLENRLAQIYTDVTALIHKYRPAELAIEELFFNTNRTTGIAVAQARGVILLCAAQNGVQVYEYTPLQVKSAVVGYGLAEKQQVIEMTTKMLHLAHRPKLDDTADALAIAVCHAHSGSSRLKQYYNQR